jgi:hypothetical protein
MTIVFANIHVDLVNEPGQELVAVVMLVVVELAVAGAYSSNESPMIYNPSISSCTVHAFE